MESDSVIICVKVFGLVASFKHGVVVGVYTESG